MHRAIHIQRCCLAFRMRCCLAFATLAALSLFSSSSVRAQMGMDYFKPPSFAKAFHPVVGKGAEYLTTRKNEPNKPRTIELGLLSKESVDGVDGYWVQFATSDNKGESIVGKSLMTYPDFQIHRTIFQMAGRPAMEMTLPPGAMNQGKAQSNLAEWHSVGTETITVPAGTFSCDHYRNDTKNSDVWVSEKVSPYGMIKEVSPDSTMVLTKIIDPVTDRITGPVQKMDLQQLMQQRQQQRQQNP
jgi:hypothetical protein